MEEAEKPKVPATDKPREVLLFPKQSFLDDKPAPRPKSGYSLSMIIAAVLFFTSIVILGGIFGYRVWYERKVVVLRDELDAKEARINLEKIAEFRRAAGRYSVAAGVFDAHVAPSNIFDILERTASIYVSYGQLSYGEESGLARLMLSGIAPNYASLYSQTELLAAASDVRSVDIEQISLDQKTGGVDFMLNIGLDPSTLTFKRYVDEHVIQTTTASPAVQPVASPSIPPAASATTTP
jgi:hypothetical protein